MNEDPTIAFIRSEVESYERLVKSGIKDVANRQEKLTHLKIVLSRLERLDGMSAVVVSQEQENK